MLTIRGHLKTYISSAFIAFPLFVITWFLIYKMTPAPQIAGEAAERLVFAIKCICTALLFSLVIVIENVSRERLFSTALDPIKGVDTVYMKFAQRLLASTLEQFVIFAFGLLGLAFTLETANELRVLVPITAVWILARFVFWIGYSRGAQYRTPGLFAMIQSLGVLIYVVCRFAQSFFGTAGVIAVLALFAIAEVVVTFDSLKRNQKLN